MFAKIFAEVPGFEPILRRLLQAVKDQDFTVIDDHYEDGRTLTLKDVLVVWNPNSSAPMGETVSYKPKAFITIFWRGGDYQALNPVYIDKTDGKLHMTPYALGPTVPHRYDMEILGQGRTIDVEGLWMLAVTPQQVVEWLA